MAQITLRDYLQEAEDAIRDDRIDDAFTHCRNILAQFPESLEAQRLLGEAYLAQGQLEEAQQSFDWILTNDPENVVAYCNRALICERSLDYDTALDCYQQAYELSHGNSQIRQEFNRLSTETGPQGFMFSRAGLARLYMRGDLLTQAIQEWETVLALSSERLDARTGLLETCWRDGHYDRVEQLATQILQDVPGCLKALFLLAYVSSAKNIEQARELLKRAEALDPDLLMAQELFSDIMARQPAEPFLELLKKAPVTLETALPQSPITQVPGQQEASAQPSPMSLSSEALAAWNGAGSIGSSESWGTDVTLIKDAQQKRQAQESSLLAEANPALDVWSVLEQKTPQGVGFQQELQNVSPQLQATTNDINPLNNQPVQSLQPSAQQEEPSLEAWLPEPSANMAAENNQKEAEFPLWDGTNSYDDFKEPASNGNSVDAPWPSATGFGGDSGIWGNPASASGDSGIWGNPAKENATPSPPAWLNMLTQSEIRQLNDEEAPKPSPVAEPVAPTPPVPPVRNAVPEVTSKPTNDEEEAFSFGPEWLKSLGAAPIDDESSPVEATPVSPLAAPTPVVSQPLPAAQRYEPQPATYEIPEEKPQAQRFDRKVADPARTVEQNVLTTLENLEADLFSQGFVPLEPNTLQTIAKTQEPISPTVPLTPEVAVSQQETRQYDALPSLLSKLESFVQEPVNASFVAGSSSASAQMTSDAAFEESSWLASLNAVPTPSSLTERQQEMQTRQEEQMYTNLPPVQPSWESAYTPHGASSFSSAQEEVPQTPAVHSAQPTQPISGMPVWSQEKEPARGEDNTFSLGKQPAWSQVDRAQEVFAAQMPTGSARQGTEAPLARQSSHDYLLNNELETTMKRPAVRLEPMEQVHDLIRNNRVPQPPRARMAEQSYAGRSSENNLSYQERLLKGYQHQLVGDYDEAMQEYRIIIRNSPELLGEVVSNVRALLKLAPKYSTGYRVLGDAYMRQGEYLQAMEAYNKALTMAKRAKS